jgi:hypothetical protein
MDVDGVAPSRFLPELPDGLEEGEGFDVSDRSADLHDHDIHAV